MLSNKKMAIYISAIFFVVLDRFLKSLAINSNNLPFGLIGDIFQFDYARNYYISFSIPFRGLFLNILILIIIMALIAVFLKDLKEKRQDYSALAFVIAGALSNYYDRMIYGHVIDCLYLKHFTVLNLADVMISLSVAYLIVKLMFEDRQKR